MQDGKPLGNTKIFRKLQWKEDEGIMQEFMTDENGIFALPAHEEVLTLGTMTQFVGKTVIYIRDEKDSFWYLTKMDKGLNSEFDEPPQNVVCDITTPEKGIPGVNHGLCATRCRWDNMPEERDPNAL